MATTTPVLEGTYELDRTHSTVPFAIRYVGVSTFRASFADLEARLIIEDEDASLEASAVVESISIGEPPEFRDHVVRGSDFFAADAHPRISFHSTRVELAENGTAIIDGVPDIRGTQRPVTAAGTFTPPTKDPFGNTRLGFALEAVTHRAFAADGLLRDPEQRGMLTSILETLRGRNAPAAPPDRNAPNARAQLRRQSASMVRRCWPPHVE
jgi:polyisoprenoid-binding protein YceI